MEFGEYQDKVADTDQHNSVDPDDHERDVLMHLLGLEGEAGSVATVYKKHMRDGKAYEGWRFEMREELGDCLWYLATLANKLDLTMEDIAKSNLVKTRSRWLPTDIDQIDADAPADQQLPRRGVMVFTETINAYGRPQVVVTVNGEQIGQPLTDNAYNDDGYRFHDVFHLAYATILGWSPVMRRNLGCKRKYDQDKDEAEDGGRAIVTEEGVSLYAFAYGQLRNSLDGIARLDFTFLDSITLMTRGFEVGVRTAADWERAILEGHRMFRELVAHGGGAVTFDADQRELTFEPPS
ncbi:nucleoside triphosphate pyrophosphohydrolase family protein [Mycobacterium riyadhense]|uniref:nucleoside triphosphate pyrophosphohydrolase family protein n=1 Tax=Mycobacterium riyadhense TaxID=486698 RepID=UPI001EF9F03C|nr:nucleoside triphosphate pyrophosphohydrolase family protein [Mycobacterium riyadhense]